MRRQIGVLTLIVLLCASAPLLAQTGSGALTGKVVDEQGGVLPGVRVVATHVQTGISREGITGSDGRYRFPALPVGTYTLRFELAGFTPLTVENAVVNVASTLTQDVTLKVAAVAEEVTVTATIPLVATSPAVGTVVSQEELANLPLNGRQFANLGILAPGTNLAVNPDPTKPGQLTIALNGGIGRNVNFIIDGGDNTDDTIGGALQNFNLEAVQEFKIQTMQYKAEYGRSSGGVLTVVTKTGTNEFKGSAWGFFRNDSLNARTESEKQAGIDKQAYDRKQYGFALGGPIAKDLAHFFVTWERTDRETNYTVDSGGIYPELDGKTVPLPFKDDLITAKATYNISPKQYLQVRYGYQKNDDKYGASPLAAPNNLGTISNKYYSILLGHNWQVSDNALNEFLFQYSKFKNVITADSNEPLLYYPSGFSYGQNINTPQSTNQVKYQYKDDFTFTKEIGGKHHDFKVGVQYIHEPVLGGDFSTGLNGQYSMLEDRKGSPVTDITFYGGFFGDKTPVDQYSIYAQDDWYLSNQVTLSVGLRYDFWDGFDLDQRSNPIWQVLSTQTEYNEYYLRDFQGGRGGKLKNDKNNWGPRLGVVWDVKGDGKQLLRAGVGRFFDFPYTNATILFPAAAVQSNYGVVYNYFDPNGIRNPDGSFYQPGQPLPPNQLPGAEVFPPNEVASPTLATPYSDQASLGYSWQVLDWLGLNFEAVRVRYRDIPFRFRANPGVDVNGDGVYNPADGDHRRFPQFGNFRIWYGKGRADYKGINIGFRARAEKFEFQGFYTWSKAWGNVLAGADEFRLTDIDHQPDLRAVRDQSVNPYDPLCDKCIGPLNTDARHRITLAGFYRAPWGINISGMFRYRSALPYTEWAGTDLNGDGMRFDLPSNVSHVNNRRGHSFSQFDVRISKEFTFAGDIGVELIAEVFNLFNSKNPAGYVGNRLAANFGRPTSYAGDPLQGEQRLGQLGLRIRF